MYQIITGKFIKELEANVAAAGGTPIGGVFPIRGESTLGLYGQAVVSNASVQDNIKAALSGSSVVFRNAVRDGLNLSNIKDMVLEAITDDDVKAVIVAAVEEAIESSSPIEVTNA